MYNELVKEFERKFNRNLSDTEKIKLKELTKEYKRKEILDVLLEALLNDTINMKYIEKTLYYRKNGLVKSYNYSNSKEILNNNETSTDVFHKLTNYMLNNYFDIEHDVRVSHPLLMNLECISVTKSVKDEIMNNITNLLSQKYKTSLLKFNVSSRNYNYEDDDIINSDILLIDFSLDHNYDLQELDRAYQRLRDSFNINNKIVVLLNFWNTRY